MFLFLSTHFKLICFLSIICLIEEILTQKRGSDLAAEEFKTLYSELLSVNTTVGICSILSNFKIFEIYIDDSQVSFKTRASAADVYLTTCLPLLEFQNKW